MKAESASEGQSQTGDAFEGWLTWTGKWMVVNAPLAVLEVARDGLLLRPKREGLLNFIPARRIPLEEIELAERARQYFPTFPGVRFRSEGDMGSFIFWTLRAGELLDAAEEQGVPVDRTTHWIGYFRPLGLKLQAKSLDNRGDIPRKGQLDERDRAAEGRVRTQERTGFALSLIVFFGLAIGVSVALTSGAVLLGAAIALVLCLLGWLTIGRRIH